MRLWNLVTGKKAGVLNFGREVLQGVGVGRHETGEARRVVWDGSGEAGGGEEFVVGWERGAVVYGVDCVPRVRIVFGGRGGGRVGGGVKVHQMRYFPGWKGGDGKGRCLSVSTEDGRIIFFSTAATREGDVENETTASSSPDIPLAAIIGEIGPSTTSPSRIKDFKILSRQLQDDSYQYLLVAGSSDGSISIWQLDPSKFSVPLPSSSSSSSTSTSSSEATNGTTTLNSSEAKAKPPQVGSQIGTYHTSGRITCLEAMVVTLPFTVRSHRRE